MLMGWVIDSANKENAPVLRGQSVTLNKSRVDLGSISMTIIARWYVKPGRYYIWSWIKGVFTGIRSECEIYLVREAENGQRRPLTKVSMARGGLSMGSWRVREGGQLWCIVPRAIRSAVVSTDGMNWTRWTYKFYLCDVWKTLACYSYYLHNRRRAPFVCGKQPDIDKWRCPPLGWYFLWASLFASFIWIPLLCHCNICLAGPWMRWGASYSV